MFKADERAGGRVNGLENNSGCGDNSYFLLVELQQECLLEGAASGVDKGASEKVPPCISCSGGTLPLKSKEAYCRVSFSEPQERSLAGKLDLDLGLLSFHCRSSKSLEQGNHVHTGEMWA